MRKAPAGKKSKEKQTVSDHRADALAYNLMLALKDYKFNIASHSPQKIVLEVTRQNQKRIEIVTVTPIDYCHNKENHVSVDTLKTQLDEVFSA